MNAADYDAKIVKEDEIGACVIRMQHDTASMNDVAAVLNMLIKSADFRNRCSVLGNLSNHLPRRKREENAEASCHLIFSRHLPLEDAPKPGDDWAKVDPRFIVQCSPMRGSNWEEHFDAKYSKQDAMSEARVSPYVQTLIHAVEDMWNVPGHLINNR